MILIKRRFPNIIASLLIIALLAGYGVFALFLNPAQGASLTSVKDTLSTSAPSTAANHTITFTTPTGITAGKTITLTFPDIFNATGTIDFRDIDMASSTDYSIAASASGDTWGVSTSSTAVVLTSGTGIIAAGTTLTIEVGTNATFGTAGVHQMTNPAKVAAASTADTYTVSIAGTMTDSGSAMIAIIEGVAVSVTIAQSLTFNINSETNANCDTAFSTLGGPDTTSTTVPFGSISTINTFFHACQQLVISTNASSGYAITASEDQSLKSGSNLLKDTSCDNSGCNATTSGAWATNTNNGFGYACANISGSNGGCVTTSTTIYRSFACTGNSSSCTPISGASAVNIMASTTTANAHASRIQYKLSYNATQAAGAYSNTITYIATPTF